MDFFNGLGRKFTNVARTVQEITRDSVENNRLSSDMKSAEEELDRRCAVLGRAYFETLENPDAKIPASVIDAVRDAMNRVAALTAQRDRLNRRTRCPACGAVQAEDANFCSNCGRAMPEAVQEAPAPDAEAEYCERCGAMRGGEARFCEVCGGAFDPEDRIPELPDTVRKVSMPPAEEPDYAEHME